MSKSFYQIHFTGEGFRTLEAYRLFFRRALQEALQARADYEAEVRDWYENGDGQAPDWRTESDDEGHTWRWNAGGLGHAFPHCIHGSSLVTDYDNICGGCEEGETPIQGAIVRARESFLRFNSRWEWICDAPGDLDNETRRELTIWAASLFPGWRGK